MIIIGYHSEQHKQTYQHSLNKQVPRFVNYRHQKGGQGNNSKRFPYQICPSQPYEFITHQDKENASYPTTNGTYQTNN